MLKKSLSRIFENLNYKHIARTEMAAIAAPFILSATWMPLTEIPANDISDAWLEIEDWFRIGFDVERGSERGPDYPYLFNALRIIGGAPRMDAEAENIRLRKIDLQFLRRHYKLLNDAADYLEFRGRYKDADPELRTMPPGVFNPYAQNYNRPGEDWGEAAAKLRQVARNFDQFFARHTGIKPASGWNRDHYMDIKFD